MHTRDDVADGGASMPGPRPGLRAVSVAVLLAVLAAAPAPAQQPADTSGGERGADPFEGASLFDRAPDRGVSTTRLRLEAAEPPPLVSASDFYRVSFLAESGGAGPSGSTARVLRSNPLDLEIPPSVRTGDRVVLALNGLAVRAGDTLQAVRRGRNLPGGRPVMHSLALVELLRVEGDSARGVVRSVFADYQVGDPVIRAEPFPAGRIRALEPAAGRLVARVVGLETPQALVATNDRVFLDAGTRHGLGAGDELLAFPGTTADPTRADPAERLGTLRVVRARPGSATARVVETRDVGLRAGCVAVRVRRAVSGDR